MSKVPKELEAENKILRRLLWIAYSLGRGYGDDGEMQFEGIDFKRMPIEELQAAITCLGVQRIDEYLASPEGQALIKRVE